MKKLYIFLCFVLFFVIEIYSQQGGVLGFEYTSIDRSFNSESNTESIYLFNYTGKPLKALQFKIIIKNGSELISNISAVNGVDIPQSKFLFDYEIHNKFDKNGSPFIEISSLLLGNDFNELKSKSKYHLAEIKYDINQSQKTEWKIDFNLIDVTGATASPVEDARILIGNNLTINLTEKPISKDQNKLFQNFPNPFNPTTNILYVIEKPGFVNLKIFNSIGEEIETLINGYQNEGEYSVIFNGNSDLPSGVYFYRLQIGGFVESKRMVFIK